LWLIASVCVALAAIIPLSAGLTGLELLPGRFYLFGTSSPVAGNAPAGDGLLAAWQAVNIFVLALTPLAVIVLIVFIVSPQSRKRVIRIVLYAALAYLLIYLWTRNGQRIELDAAELAASEAAQASPQPAPEFDGQPPEWLVLAASLTLVALAGTAGWLLWRRAHPPAGPLERVAEQAQQAIDALRSGGDVTDVVTRCYVDMSYALFVQRGVRRGATTTPREFEQRLENLGLPAEPVRRLTRLFEGVRYGSKTPGEREQNEALSCLTAILHASGRTA
jgi:hypothetical protein